MMTKNVLMRRIGIVALLLVLVPAMSLAKTIYVKQGASGNGTGWTNAYGNLQGALDSAVSGDQIWVATGSYVPTSENGLNLGFRFRHFRMKNGVAIYGGFSGTETLLAQRDIYAHETILSGDIYGNDGPDFVNNAENCLHIFFHPDGTNLNATAVLDGFTIYGGNANSGPADYGRGGGMANYNSSPTVVNCTFVANCGVLGGGMYNSSSSHPTVSDCTFSDNKANYHGGGMANDGLSEPVVSDCVFSGNTAETYHGGGMLNNASSPMVINCTFSGNAAGYYGGGMANSSESMIPSNPTVTNCIFYGNSAAVSDNEMRNSGCTPTIAYSNIAGCLNGASWNTVLGIDGGGNMDANPNFDEFLQLQAGSPCIDAADGTAASSTDLLGNSRYDDPATSNIGTGNPRYVDMGAYEFQGDVGTTTYTLSVYSSGATGVVISSSTGHSGTTNYTKTVNDGTTVTLTAPVLSGKTFTGWTGSVNSSSQTISTALNANKSVTANYETTITTYSINVYSSGATSVPISSTTGHGGTTDYIKTVNDGTTVTLTAPTISGKNFTGWTGSVSSSSQTISLAMNANKFVTANYEAATSTTTYPLYVYSSGASAVAISSSTGHSGTTFYSQTINEGTTVTLTAPATWGGMVFDGWTGAVTSANRTISLPMTAMKYVIANYQEGTAPTLSSISISGSTQVDETSGAQYTATAYYSDGSSANVTSSANWSENSAYASISSSGYLTTGSVSSDQTCTITASYGGKSDTHSVTIKNVAAIPTTYTLSVSSSGATGVSISSSTGQGGTTNYAKTVNDGTTVTLTAPAVSGGATFTGWTGAVTSTSQTISLSMTANKSVTANYETVATTSMHVQSIVLSVIEAGGPNRKGQAIVTIYDSSNRPVSGATVVGTFTGAFNESGSATTNASGQATIITASKAKNPSFTFTVSDVTAAGYTYDPASNVETSDSY